MFNWLKGILFFRQPFRRFIIANMDKLPEKWQEWLLCELYPPEAIVNFGSEE